MKRLIAAVTLSVLLMTCACTAHTPTGHTLCISEVQSAGGESDWIELYNYGDRSVSLQGWYLSDDPDAPGKSPLPVGTLQAGERLVLTAGSNDKNTLAFRLSAGGETVVLSDPHGTAVQTVELPASVPGLSYGCMESEKFPPARLVWYAEPTPGESNEHGMMLGENATATQYGVRINEFVTRNKTSLYDEEGDYGDWVELYNFSDTAVDIAGWSLTDAQDTVTRWQFPANTVIPADGYLVVFCDGKDNRTASGELHTNFRLGQTDSFLGLYTADGAFCSGVTCELGEQDAALGCNTSGAVVPCRYPTPYAPNAVETEVTQP